VPWYAAFMAVMRLDEALLAVLPGAHPEPAEQVRELAVLELYRRRVITSGKAAELLGMRRDQLILHASRLGIPYLDLDAVESEREVEASRTVR